MRTSRLTGEQLPHVWTYAYTVNQNFGRNAANVSMAAVKEPASIIYASEGIYQETRPYWWPRGHYQLEPRHNEGVNNAFADGHAKWLRIEEAEQIERWYFDGGVWQWPS